MAKLARKLERLRRVAPKGPTSFGQFYSIVADTRKKFRRITLYTAFRSPDDDVMIRDHVFERKRSEAKTPKEWSAWFAKRVPLDPLNPDRDLVPRLTFIHKRAILPGLRKKTGMFWSVERIIGWIGSGTGRKKRKRVVLKSRNTKVGRGRHSNKRKGKKRGKNRVRRRQ